VTNSLFVDTSGWANLYISTENYHSQAAEIFQKARQQKQTIMTTNYVLNELVALLYSPLGTPRPHLFRIVDAIKTASFVQLIHVTPEIDQLAWELCKARPDKPWSLVDCTSFIVMQHLGIQSALTTDRHFEQAGFVRLLK
jgi:predicted nucleic acid-binding protein